MPNFIASGTVNVTTGQTLVTFEDVLLTEARSGDTLELYGANKGRYTLASIGADLVSAQLSVPFDGVTQTDAPYTIRYDSLQRVPPLELADQLRRMRDQIRIFERTAPLYRVQGILNAPPASPVAGDFYLVWTAPTGAWVGQAGNLAQWTGSVWQFTTPEGGWIVYNIATGQQFIRGLTGWQVYVAPSAFMAPAVAAVNGPAALAALGAQAALGYTPFNAAGVSTFGASLVDDADQAAARATLGAQAALGFTPVNKGGDALNGTLTVRPTANDIWSLAHGTAMTLADAGAIGWAAGSGYLMIADHNNGNHALFKVANTVVQRLDSGAGYSTTAGNSGTLNVYWNAGGFFYVLENRRGGPVSVSVVNIKVRSAG